MLKIFLFGFLITIQTIIISAATCPAGCECPSFQWTGTVIDQGVDDSSLYPIYPCPAGSFSLNGQTSCSSCPAGTFSPARSSSCITCPIGTFAPASSSVCIHCLIGSYCPSPMIQISCAQILFH